MSALTDYTEGNLINHIFRTASYVPPANLFFGYLSAVADAEAGTVTEFALTNSYARVSVARNGANFTRTNQQIKNSVAITHPTPTGAWGTATHWGIFDAATGGNLLMYGVLDDPKVIGAASPAPSWEVNGFTFNFTMTSDYLANALADWLFIGTAYAKPTALDFALYTALPAAAGGGTEVAAVDYARVSTAPLDTNFDAVAAGDGHTQNTNLLTFPAPDNAAYGDVLGSGLYDQLSNLLTFSGFPTVTINAGDAAPKIAVGAFDVTIG